MEPIGEKKIISLYPPEFLAEITLIMNLSLKTLKKDKTKIITEVY